MLNAVGNLHQLRPVLASEPCFDSVITGRDAVLVVTEAARALTVAERPSGARSWSSRPLTAKRRDWLTTPRWFSAAMK